MDMDFFILIIAGIALVAALVLLRLRRMKAFYVEKGAAGHDNALERIILLRSQLPTAADQRACDRIEARIRAVSRQFSMQTSIAPKKVYELAADLTREIAANYHPEAEDPVLQASISDLLRLNERIVTRLNLKLREFPFNTVKDLNIQKILKGKNFYDAKIKNKIEWLRKFEGLYKAGSRAWMSYNILNPWYWGRKIAYTSVKEITFRYLLTWIITIVGEEAITVYSQRNITTSEAVYERDLAFAMVDMARTHNPVPGEAYALVLDHIFNKARLNDTARIEIARALTTESTGGRFKFHGGYTKAQADRLMDKVNRVAAAGGNMDPEIRDNLEKLEATLAQLVQDSE